MNRWLAVAALPLLLAGCGGGDAPATAPPATPSANAGEVVARAGDVTMHASVMQTSALDARVAADYGIARSERTVLLLVAVRKGADAQEAAMPARVTAVATDLDGRQRVIEMRELRTGSLLDYVGSLDVSLPETLRFDIDIVRADGQRSQMQFSREFFPR